MLHQQSYRTGSTGRRQQQEAEEPSAVDPIFNYMTIASPLEQEMLNSTMGDGGDGTGGMELQLTVAL